MPSPSTPMSREYRLLRTSYRTARLSRFGADGDIFAVPVHPKHGVFSDFYPGDPGDWKLAVPFPSPTDLFGAFGVRTDEMQRVFDHATYHALLMMPTPCPQVSF